MNRFSWLSIAFVMMAESILPASVWAETDTSRLEGKVTKQDSLPRLSRPASPSLSDLSAPQVLNGKVDADKQELLKARVMNAAGLRDLTPSAATPGRGKSGKYSLGAKDLQRLCQYDISVLIDASGSMASQDCEPLNVFTMGGRVSRWEWCRQQASILSEEVAPVFPKGITVVPFNSGASRFTNVTPEAIGEIFNEAHPVGGTRLDEALDIELSAYFSEKEQGLRKKPLLIAVITDGVPNFPGRVADEILEVINRTRPGEVRIEFFLIGEARRGDMFSDLISNFRFNAGAPFDVVTRHRFEELCEQGLPRSLAHAVETANANK